jgi:hypothetical protein
MTGERLRGGLKVPEPFKAAFSACRSCMTLSARFVARLGGVESFNGPYSVDGDILRLGDSQRQAPLCSASASSTSLLGWQASLPSNGAGMRRRGFDKRKCGCSQSEPYLTARSRALRMWGIRSLTSLRAGEGPELTSRKGPV